MKKVVSFLILLTAILATTQIALGQSGRRGNSPSRDPAQAICTTKEEFIRNIKDSTVFMCSGGLPNLTLAQIFDRGYKIVQISSYPSEDANYLYLDHMLLIERK